VTTLWAAVQASLTVCLVGLVLRFRLAERRFAPGAHQQDGPTDPLFLAQRAHGNQIEWVPLALVLSLIAELGGGLPSLWLHGIHAIFFLGRIVLTWGVLTVSSRRTGAIISTITTVILAAVCVRISVQQLTGNAWLALTAAIGFFVALFVVAYGIIMVGNFAGRLRPKNGTSDDKKAT